jgi:protein quaking
MMDQNPYFKYNSNTNHLFNSSNCLYFPSIACEEEWRRVAAAAAVAETRLMSPGMPTMTANQMRAQATPLGAPLILSPRMSVPTTAASLLSGAGPPQMDHHTGLIYATPYTDYTNYAALAAGNPILTEYTDHTGGLFAR